METTLPPLPQLLSLYATTRIPGYSQRQHTFLAISYYISSHPKAHPAAVYLLSVEWEKLAIQAAKIAYFALFESQLGYGIGWKPSSEHTESYHYSKKIEKNRNRN